MYQDKFTQIKNVVDKAHTNTQDTRERGADDWIFAHFNQWDEGLEEYSDNEYRGQFDIISRQLRQVKGEMLANPISVKFRPSDNNPKQKRMSDVLQGLYRASMRTNAAKEAVDVAVDCQVSTGLGAWRIVTEYEDQGDNSLTKQVITRKPIHEANNVVYFDPQSKRKDKADAKWCCLLTWYTDEGYKDLMRDFGIGEEERTPSTFKTPEDSGVFPWNSGERHYVGEYYEVVEKTKKMAILSNPAGQQERVSTKARARLAELADLGYEIVARKDVKSREVFKYVVDGQGIIDGPQKVAGKHIPIIPVFGEWRFIEGQEWWEGMVRRAKDPQRLHNMSFSFIADQVGRTPRRKPFFHPEQIKGWEQMYAQDADYAYYLINSKDDDGNPLPNQPIGYMEGPNISGTETEFLRMTEKAVQDVTVTPLVGENALSDGVTEGQLRLANSQSQMQTFVYQDALATAMRRDGEVWLSIAADIYDEEDELIIMKEDDTTEYVEINKVAFDEFGMPYLENEIPAAAMEVYTDVGPRFQDQKQEAERKLSEIVSQLGGQDPLGRVALMEYMSMIDIPGDSALEGYINKQRLEMGLKQPETREEQMYLMQLQQQKASQQDPNMVLAQAEMMKAQASMADKQNDQAKISIDGYNAQTKRLEAAIKEYEAALEAERTQAEIQQKNINMNSTQIKSAIEYSKAVQGR